MIDIDIKEIACEDMNWNEVAQSTVVGLCKYSNELLGSMMPEPLKLLKLLTACRRP
jgi:hypothetical protein